MIQYDLIFSLVLKKNEEKLKVKFAGQKRFVY